MSQSTVNEQELGRFADMVYAAALRQMNEDTHGATDVTQAVFIVAMEKRRAGRLPGEERLEGWLLKVTGFCAKKAKRAAMRRSFHEQRAMETRSETMRQESSVNEITQVLDEALLKLGAIDREVVVRRYLRGETVGAVAAAVRMTENAASQRIGRALEKLRKILGRRGVVAPAAALTGVMIAESAKAAPAALTVAGVAAGGGGANAAAMSIAKGAVMAMKMAAFKTAAVCVVVMVVIGVVVACSMMPRHEAPSFSKTLAAIAAANEEAKVPGVTQLARWGVILNEAGAAEVKKACTPFVTESKVEEVEAEKGKGKGKEPTGWENVPRDGRFWNVQCGQVEDGSPVEVGVLVGLWKQVGSLYENQSITAGGVEYRVDQGLAYNEKDFLVHFWRKGVLANEDELVPATVDGKTVTAETYMGETIFYGHEPTMVSIVTGTSHTAEWPIVYGPRPTAVDSREERPSFHGMALKEVKEFRIYQRKREWVRFEGFAREPKVTPAVEVSAEAVEEAEAAAKGDRVKG